MAFGNSQVQLCNGGYIARTGCYPFCPSADGWGCEYGSQGGSNPLGLTQNYTVTTGDVSAGNRSTRFYAPVIDPYQVQRPDEFKNFTGETVTQKVIPALVMGLFIGVGLYGMYFLTKSVSK